MKGMILAGGSGTRLYPNTIAVGKQLLPIYDKPMVYYALTTLISAGIRDVLLISTPHDMPHFQQLLGNGASFGITLGYQVQAKPEGIAQAFLLGEAFIGQDSVALILGDNLFWGPQLPALLKEAALLKTGGLIFGCRVKDPQRYGVLSLGSQGELLEIQEKPKNPSSSYAVPGLYFYDSSVVEIAKKLLPSARGELEITDLNNQYLRKNALQVKLLPPETVWLDAGTTRALHEASSFVHTLQERQGYKIGCPEGQAYVQGWISREELLHTAQKYCNSEYGAYLRELSEEDSFKSIFLNLSRA